MRSHGVARFRRATAANLRIQIGLSHRRTKPPARGPRNRRARNPLDSASDVVCRASHDLGGRAVEVKDDHGPVVGENVRARADLMDLAACAHLPQQEHRLTRCKPLVAFPHTCKDVERTTSVSAPNDFLTRRPSRSHLPRELEAIRLGPRRQFRVPVDAAARWLALVSDSDRATNEVVAALRVTTPRGARLVWHGFVLACVATDNTEKHWQRRTKPKVGPEACMSALKATPDRSVTARAATSWAGAAACRRPPTPASSGCPPARCQRSGRARWSERELANGHNNASVSGCAGPRGWGLTQ
jgi:hypothetical protein